MNKKITPIFTGHVEDGKLIIERRQEMDDYIAGIKGEVEVIIKKRKKKRSLSANALYWVYLNLISQDTGHTVEELHNLFKEKFIESETVEVFGLQMKKYKTTTDMSSMEFSDYIRKIEVLTEILCPNPEEVVQNFKVE